MGAKNKWEVEAWIVQRFSFNWRCWVRLIARIWFLHHNLQLLTSKTIWKKSQTETRSSWVSKNAEIAKNRGLQNCHWSKLRARSYSKTSRCLCFDWLFEKNLLKISKGYGPHSDQKLSNYQFSKAKFKGLVSVKNSKLDLSHYQFWLSLNFVTIV